MGKVLSRVLENVHLGPVIASSVSCDYLMACGVSDWGGYAIACGLYIARNCITHDRYRRYGIKDEEGKLDIDELMFNDTQVRFSFFFLISIFKTQSLLSSRW